MAINSQQWNGSIMKKSPTQFLQTWEWGQFQKSLGRDVQYLENEACLTVIIKQPLRFGYNYIYIPRGPISGDCGALKKLLEPVLEQDRSIVFVKYEPLERNQIEKGSVKVKSYQPKDTSIIDLTKDEDALLAAMHEKTRYNIRLAEKKGVIVEEGAMPVQFDRFIELLTETASRDRFHLHDPEYYKKLIEFFSPSAPNNTTPFVQLKLARYSGEIIAGILVMHFGDSAVYLHGASSDKNRNVMAPYLLQWHAIKEAKKLGLTQYDLGGTAPADEPDHPWAGITRFKTGFGGAEFSYPGTYDLPIKMGLYKLYQLAKKTLQ